MPPGRIFPHAILFPRNMYLFEVLSLRCFSINPEANTSQRYREIFLLIKGFKTSKSKHGQEDMDWYGADQTIGTYQDYHARRTLGQMGQSHVWIKWAQQHHNKQPVHQRYLSLADYTIAEFKTFGLLKGINRVTLFSILSRSWLAFYNLRSKSIM